jgi:hypothetical protein
MSQLLGVTALLGPQPPQLAHGDVQLGFHHCYEGDLQEDIRSSLAPFPINTTKDEM